MTEWISVKDRLPKAFQEVILPYNGAIYLGYLTAETFPRWCIPSFDDIEYVDVDDLTHWMPLPEMPE